MCVFVCECAKYSNCYIWDIARSVCEDFPQTKIWPQLFVFVSNRIEYSGSLGADEDEGTTQAHKNENAMRAMKTVATTTTTTPPPAVCPVEQKDDAHSWPQPDAEQCIAYRKY